MAGTIARRHLCLFEVCTADLILSPVADGILAAGLSESGEFASEPIIGNEIRSTSDVTEDSIDTGVKCAALLLVL